jgi:hypothetical protein
MSLASRISTLSPEFQEAFVKIIREAVIPSLEENAESERKLIENPIPGIPQKPGRVEFLTDLAEALKFVVEK